MVIEKKNKTPNRNRNPNCDLKKKKTNCQQLEFNYKSIRNLFKNFL